MIGSIPALAGEPAGILIGVRTTLRFRSIPALAGEPAAWSDRNPPSADPGSIPALAGEPSLTRGPYCGRQDGLSPRWRGNPLHLSAP